MNVALPTAGSIYCVYLAYRAGTTGHDNTSKMMGIFAILFLLFAYRMWKAKRGY